jgi:hypothetical protein
MRAFLAAALSLVLTTAAALAQNGPSLAPRPPAAAFAGVPNWVYGSFAPAGTASTSYVMLGLGYDAGDISYAAKRVPIKSGAFLVTIAGSWQNSLVSDGCQIEPGWGTGPVPVNGVPVPATFNAMTASPAWTAAAPASPVPFARTFMFHAVLWQPIYVDLAVKAVTGGTCTLPQVDVSISEL